MVRLCGAWCAVGLSLCVGCGGATSDDAGGAGSGGPSWGGVGGSAATGGVGASAATGGASAGGSAGTGGQAGDPSRCNAPQPYSCEAGATKFVFDPATATCKPLGAHQCSGGIEGYEFATLAECLSECGGRPAADACDVPSDCVLIDSECCACEPFDVTRLESVNRRYFTDDRCDRALCGPCPAVGELSTTRQYFVPTCSFGACSILDIRQETVTECRTDADCSLRDGSECCPGCDGIGLVAVSSTALFVAQCGPAMDCPACLPPAGPYVPRCNAGRCQVGGGLPIP